MEQDSECHVEKLVGNDNVKKLCIIMLFEVDFNHNNKWLGRATMKVAEEQQLLVLEQYTVENSKQLAPNF